MGSTRKKVPMNGNRRIARGRSLIAPAVAATLALGLPAWAGPVHSGGPWYVGGIDYCAFSGDHYAEANYARGRTTNNNGECGQLKVKLKYKRTSDSSIVDMVWLFSVGAPSSLIRTAPDVSTAQASQHQVHHPFSNTWSAIQQPHAY
jgi:hypothetical protein